MSIQKISGPSVGSAGGPSVAERIAGRLYWPTRRFEAGHENQPTNTSARASQPVTLVCISDTHNTFPSPLPMGDVLVHAGDLSQYGTFAEVQAQLKWLDSQPHSYKVVIAGNHDLLLDSDFVAAHPDRELDRHPGRRRSDLDWGGIHYLEHGSVDLFLPDKGRSIRVFGSPWTPRFGTFAFQYDDTGETFTWENSVPAGTDVMVVHGPPKGHLDNEGKGCEKLLVELWRAKPKVVVCGHIHAGRGEERLLFDRSQANYEHVVLGRTPWICLLNLAMCYIWYRLRTVMGSVSSREQAKSTHLVNAAVVGGRGNSEHRDAIVVTM